MLAIPGKSCGSCNQCCQVLEIEEMKKPPGLLCGNCVPGGGCSVYLERPQVCRDYVCLWKDDRGLGPQMRPDRVGTLLMEDDAEQYLAVCDPKQPFAWRTPIMFKHLVAMAKSGRIVVAKAGEKAWRIHASGQWGPYTQG